MRRRIVVEPGKKADLATATRRGRARPATPALAKDELKREAVEQLAANVQALAAAQEKLYADDRYALLVVFQAMDAAGKDGTIKHVMSGINPQGVQVFSFKQPSTEELDHNWFWRYWRHVPERGRIGIFNRSYYEEVLIQRVHPEWIEQQRLPPGKRDKQLWAQRYEDINGFERHLDANGIKVVKFFLNVSKAEQKRRFLARLDEKDKNWKFSAGDVRERRFWDAYQAAYEEALTATSTPWAPWHVIPADHKHVMRALVSEVLVDELPSLDLAFPTVSEAELAELDSGPQGAARPSDAHVDQRR